MGGPLSGVRVLDFGRVLAAPYGTLNLADMGADVLKVEHPRGGDDTRSFGPPFVDGMSTYFMSVNRGKRSISLDLSSDKDKEIALKLACASDVIVENFRPGVMKRLGLGAEKLLQINPRLVYASISGFGREDPRPGYDLLVQGLSGIPSITGPVDGVPHKCGASIADLVAGMNMVQGILAALFRREQTGKGGIVDIPMFDGQISLLTYHASAYLNAGQPPRRMGNGHPSIHPFRPYAASDGFINICIGNDHLFVQLCVALGHQEWASDSRFTTNPLRVAHRKELNALLEPIFETKSRADWKEILDRHGVPADGIMTVPEALAESELVRHDHPSGNGEIRSIPLPFSLDGEPRSSPRRPPMLGEHREEVLREWLGYSD